MRTYSEKYGEELRKQKKEYEEKMKREERKKRIIQAILIPLSVIGIIVIIYYVSKSTPQQVISVPEKPTKKYSYTVTPLINEEYFEIVHKALGRAKKSIKILMLVIKIGDYPDHPVNILLQDLIKAHKRGVEVKVILEGSQYKKEKSNIQTVNFLRNAGIDAKLDHPITVTHDKLIIIDDNLAIIGAHNWSYMALTKNNEISFLIKSEPPNLQFVSYFREVEHQIR